VLARRIVEDRAANGAFGSMQGFERVRGVGPLSRTLLA
jgi:DNA uptake protein ComE-like DNA-binding protein